ncbi:MAG: hypothetical protein IKB25_12880 [Lentisphaeria bacterium]|nr:hypothetical protein [Lentisphaeria bacterium]
MIHISLSEKLKFDEIYQREALYRSALNLYTKSLFCRNKARTTSWDGKTLYDFAGNGTKELDMLHKAVVNRKFSFSPAKPLKIIRNEKERIVYIWPWRERVVDLMLYQQLNQRLDHCFSPSVYAFRWHGYGVDQCQNKVKRFICRHSDKPIYVIKRDVANCFPSIPHELLKEVVASITVKDDYLEKLLLDHVSYSYFQDDGELITADSGVPFGAPTACLLANLALKPFDDALTVFPESCYSRYADDMLFLTVNSEFAKVAAEKFDTIFEQLGLVSKASAAVNGILTDLEDVTPEPGFTVLSGQKHLGLYFKPGGTVSLALDKQRKICNLFRKAFAKCKRRLQKTSEVKKRVTILCHAANYMLEKTQSQIAIIDYYLKHINDVKQLQLLDRWLAEEVLSIALNTGHKKGNFAKFSFQKLREAGLPSLVHRRNLLLHGHIESSFLRWKMHNRSDQSLTVIPK